MVLLLLVLRRLLERGTVTTTLFLFLPLLSIKGGLYGIEVVGIGLLFETGARDVLFARACFFCCFDTCYASAYFG